MHHIDEWFFTWLDYHQRLHPNRQWVRSESHDACDYYAGWIECFERIGATPELAQRASRNLQETPPKFLNEHLPAIKNAIYEAKKEESATPTARSLERTNPEQVQAAIDSHECPECSGTGWAQRQAYWPSLGWSPMVDLFCRCPHGRWRKRNDPDLHSGSGRNFDDLQAWPAVWNPDFSFPAWSNKPVAAESIADQDTERQWHYIPPGQVVGGAGDFAPLVHGLVA